MGDYVLESNPALERLIERDRAQDVPPPPEEGSSSRGHANRFWRGRRSTAHPVDHPEVLRGDPSAGGATSPAERTTVEEPPIVAEEAAVVEDDLWAIHKDLQPPDEMVLVDFDEEPEVFDEDPGNYGEDEEADEADEVLDVYEDADWDDEDEEEDVNDEVLSEVMDAGADVLEENRHVGSDWIFDAFEAWKVEIIEDDVVHDDFGLEALVTTKPTPTSSSMCSTKTPRIPFRLQSRVGHSAKCRWAVASQSEAIGGR